MGNQPIQSDGLGAPVAAQLITTIAGNDLQITWLSAQLEIMGNYTPGSPVFGGSGNVYENACNSLLTTQATEIARLTVLMKAAMASH